MKTKHLLLALAALLAACGWWAGRTFWRAHRQLITLDVREMPLEEVLGKIEKQTWTKIRAEKALDAARITLHVTDLPLRDVLNRIGEQAGARWSTLYAVYNSAQARNALNAALRGNGKLEPAGWRQIAPELPPLGGPGEQANGPVIRHDANGDTPITMGPGPTGGRGVMLMRRGKNGPVTFSAGPNGQMEVWSPDELVVQSSLASQLAATGNEAPTAEVAAWIARKVHGKWTTYLAFSKSSMGVGFQPPPPGGPKPGQGFGRLPNPNERFENLTPQQRVERARQRLGMNEK